MNKKILVVSILAVFMQVAISFASAISSNTARTAKKKESPLYGIRTRRAIRERLGRIIENIKTKFQGDRIFFLPLQWLNNYIIGDNPLTAWKQQTCRPQCK